MALAKEREDTLSSTVMPGLTLRTKALAVAFLFTAVVVAGSLSFYSVIHESTEEVISTNRVMTEAAVHELVTAGVQVVDSLQKTRLLDKGEWTRDQERTVDSILALRTGRVLKLFQGMEGGFYFAAPDLFLGYSFPTSPPPVPAFGPPPRSYRIIRQQTLQAISERRQIVQLHQFDPATFPLVTRPILSGDRVVGAVWGRVHIERLLPTVRLTSVLITAAILSMIGFVVVLMIAWTLRKRTEEIRVGLEVLRTDSSFTFPERRGVFGTITRAINNMVAVRNEEQRLRGRLERELHQQDKLASLGKLTARVAHEVKTPLAVIKTRIQMWQRRLRARPGRAGGREIITHDSMAMVVQEIDRLTDLVRRLLAFSRPMIGTLIPSDLNALTSRTVHLLHPIVRKRHLHLNMSLHSHLPPVPLDAASMEQVLLNVYTNAVEAVSDGGHVSVATAADGEYACITVEDDGAGIPPEALPRIFEPFFTTKAHGAGLGLSIAYEIIRAHDGRIEFAARNGRGTACRIFIPLQLLTNKGNG